MGSVVPKMWNKKEGGVSEYYFCVDETVRLVSQAFNGRKEAIEKWNRRAEP